MRTAILVLCLVMAMLPAGQAIADNLDPTECLGQGGATLLMKGSCAVGSSLKIKMAGEPGARYKLWMDYAKGPTEVPGVGTFCFAFSPDKVVVSKGTFNARGFKSLFTQIPKDPKFVGKTMLFQFASEDENAPNGIAISNAYIFVGCKADVLEDCDQGIRRLGYFSVQNYDGDYPVDITSRAFYANDGAHTLGDVTFSYDPDNPPTFPLTASGTGNNTMTVTAVDAYPGFLVVHSVVKGCEWSNGRMPNETVFETEVGGDVLTSVQIHTSCSVPIGSGSRFPPVFITFFEDVRSAPSDSCN